MKNIFIHFMVFGGLFFTTNNLFSQEKNLQTFKIVEAPNGVNTNAYIEAMEKADFSCYRFLNKDRIITFESGVKISLHPAMQVKISSGSSKANCYTKEEDITPENDPIFQLAANGYILMAAKTTPSKVNQGMGKE